jgi:hypothetical protein
MNFFSSVKSYLYFLMLLRNSRAEFFKVVPVGHNRHFGVISLPFQGNAAGNHSLKEAGFAAEKCEVILSAPEF